MVPSSVSPSSIEQVGHSVLSETHSKKEVEERQSTETDHGPSTCHDTFRLSIIGNRKRTLGAASAVAPLTEIARLLRDRRSSHQPMSIDRYFFSTALNRIGESKRACGAQIRLDSDVLASASIMTPAASIRIHPHCDEPLKTSIPSFPMKSKGIVVSIAFTEPDPRYIQ